MMNPEAYDLPIAYFTNGEGVAKSGGELGSWTHRLSRTKNGRTVTITLREQNWQTALYTLTAASDANDLLINMTIQQLREGIISPIGDLIITKALDRRLYTLSYGFFGDTNHAVLRKATILHTVPKKGRLESVLQETNLPQSVNMTDTIMTLLYRETCINGTLRGERLTSELMLKRPVIPSDYTPPANTVHQ